MPQTTALNLALEALTLAAECGGEIDHDIYVEAKQKLEKWCNRLLRMAWRWIAQSVHQKATITTVCCRSSKSNAHTGARFAGPSLQGNRDHGQADDHQR